MEQVVLDLGLRDTFESSAGRFVLHHGFPVSENLVCRVVDRVGRNGEAREDFAERLRPAMSTVPDTLIVQVDGSIVPTRGPQPLHEVKVGLVVRSEKILSNKGRGFIEDARSVARLGNCEGF